MSAVPLIRLYSSSKARLELMRQIALRVSVRPVRADESVAPDIGARSAVKMIAARKLQTGLERYDSAGRFWSVAADTLIEGPEGLMGKPSDRDHARSMLSSLSGCRHWVHSAVAVTAPRIPRGAALRPPRGEEAAEGGITRLESHQTMVEFRELSEARLNDYLDAGEWRGAAGAYRIQGLGATLITRIDGLWSTVAGLPLAVFSDILGELAYPSGRTGRVRRLPRP